MEAVGRLEHANIIRALDAGEAHGTHYLVMEYVDGKDLAHVVKERGVFEPKQACELLQQAASGVAHAHSHGLVHRDIKPSNLFLTSKGEIKVLDLGLARLQGSGEKESDGLTSSRQVLGTPDYMAPERWQNLPDLDARVDLYALGCTLFFLITGQPPYGSHKSLPQRMMGHVNEPPPDIAKFSAGISADVSAVYRRLTAKNRDDRYASAKELVQTLMSLLRDSTPKRSGAKKSAESLKEGSSSSAFAGAPLSSRRSTSRQGPATSAAEDWGELSTLPQATRRVRKSPRPKPGANTVTVRWLLLGVAFLGVVVAAPLLWRILSKKPIESTQAATQSLASDPPSALPVVPEEIPKADIERIPPPVLAPVAEPTTAAGVSGSSTPDSVAKSIPAPAKPEWDGWPTEAPPPAVAPFDAESARGAQEAWAAYAGVQMEYVNSIGMKFTLIPPGEYLIGTESTEIDALVKEVDDKIWHERYRSEGPKHRVVITKPFYLGIHEVTQKQFETVMKSNPSWFSKSGPEQAMRERVAKFDTSSFPVDSATWSEAVDFCRQLSKRERRPQSFHTSTPGISKDPNAYRLPSEAEWECACRAGTETRHWLGDSESDLQKGAWIGSYHPGSRTHAVGELQSNPFGLFDTIGNVWEWVADAWDPATYGRRSGLTVDPVIMSGVSGQHILRGGDWSRPLARTRAATRRGDPDSSRQPDIGFRVVLEVKCQRRSDPRLVWRHVNDREVAEARLAREPDSQRVADDRPLFRIDVGKEQGPRWRKTWPLYGCLEPCTSADIAPAGRRRSLIAASEGRVQRALGESTAGDADHDPALIRAWYDQVFAGTRLGAIRVRRRVRLAILKPSNKERSPVWPINDTSGKHTDMQRLEPTRSKRHTNRIAEITTKAESPDYSARRFNR